MRRGERASAARPFRFRFGAGEGRHNAPPVPTRALIRMVVATFAAEVSREHAEPIHFVRTNSRVGPSASLTLSLSHSLTLSVSAKHTTLSNLRAGRPSSSVAGVFVESERRVGAWTTSWMSPRRGSPTSPRARQGQGQELHVFSQLCEIAKRVHADDAFDQERGLRLCDAVARLPADAILSAACADVASASTLAPDVIGYIHLYESEHVSMGIFLLPAGSRIPLHDHPGMTVVSRVLRGSLHVRSYDWAAGCCGETGPRRPGGGDAVRVFDGLVGSGTERETSVLFPGSNGNVHAFEAVEDCAVFDVICPPYNAAAGRPCTYYQAVGLSDESGAGGAGGAGGLARAQGDRVELRVTGTESDVRIVTVADMSQLLSKYMV